MTNCAADVIGKYKDASKLPIETWDRAEVSKTIGTDVDAYGDVEVCTLNALLLPVLSLGHVVTLLSST